MKTSIKVMVLDQHDYFRTALIEILNTIDGVSVVGEANDVPALLSLLEDSVADIIFFDLDVKTMQAYDYLLHIKVKYPTVFVVALSLDNTSHIIGAALKSGVNNCLPKNTTYKELENTINSAIINPVVVRESSNNNIHSPYP